MSAEPEQIFIDAPELTPADIRRLIDMALVPPAAIAEAMRVDELQVESWHEGRIMPSRLHAEQLLDLAAFLIVKEIHHAMGAAPKPLSEGARQLLSESIIAHLLEADFYGEQPS